MTIAQVLSGGARPAPQVGSYNPGMPAFRIERNEQGRLSVRTIGCCGDPDRWQREYDQVFLEQTLAEGGRVVSTGPDGVELLDRRGRTHRLGPHVTLTSV